MGQEQRTHHSFPVFNLTLPVRCASTGASGGVVAAGLVSYDTVAVNQAMFSFPTRSGYLLSATTGEVWSWPSPRSMESDVKGVHSGSNGVAVSIMLRLNALASAAVSFFVLSSLCALFLRVLLVSGPALIWPMVSTVVRLCGSRGATVDLRELHAAYPWLGIQLRYLAAAGTAPGSFLGGHITLLCVVYLAYASAVSVWSGALLGYKSHPSGLWEAISLAFLLAEWFSLLALRSKWGMLVFPRVFAALWVGWNAYYWAYPYPFSGLAFTLVISLTIALMLATVMLFEAPALRLGLVSIEKPRELLTVLPGPVAPGSAPPYESTFMALNYAPLGMYETPVPQRPPADVLGGGSAAGGEPGAQQPGVGAVAPALPGASGSDATAESDGDAQVVLVAPGGQPSTSATGRRPLLDQDQLRASGNAESF